MLNRTNWMKEWLIYMNGNGSVPRLTMRTGLFLPCFAIISGNLSKTLLSTVMIIIVYIFHLLVIQFLFECKHVVAAERDAVDMLF